VISYEGSKHKILNADYEDRLGHKELIDLKRNKLLALLLVLFTRLLRETV
jgi:hypothetical protein